MDVALVFLPLAGAIIAGLFGRMIGDRGAQWVTCSFMLLSALLAVIAFVDVIYNGN
jgi:NADH-quinone oxidoreductase subunit L